MNKLTLTALAALVSLASAGATAAAFQLAEVSTSGLGRAYAGEAAIADNAAVVATNPALMTKFKSTEISAGGVYVDSKIRMSGTVRNALGQTASADVDSVVPGALVPNAYFVTPINERFAVGGGMNVNYGLKSEYDNDYAAGVFGGTTDLTAINLNLSGAYKISRGWSFGLGLNAVYAKAKIERNAGIAANVLNYVAAQSGYSAGVTSSTVLTHLQDKSAWGFGWNAGLLYEINENNRFGLAYHSHVNIDFTDNTAVSYAPYGVMPYVGKGSLTLHLPAYWEFSGYHKMTEKLAVHYSYKYTEWSRLKDLHGIYASYPTGGRTDTAFRKEEGFRDNSRLAIGVTYDVNEALTLRAGIAHDESAVGEHASASIPDTDRTWYAFGATYRFTPNLSADFGFAHLRGSKTSFSETYTSSGTTVASVSYQSKASANLYGININYKF